MSSFGLEFNMNCTWHPGMACNNDFICDGCEMQPADDDKPFGKAAPVRVEWESFEDSKFPVCPSCGEMPYDLKRCVFCGQKFLSDEKTREWEKPPEEVVYDCFLCGGKGTMKGSRAKSNGHFHGKCTKCGARIIE